MNEFMENFGFGKRRNINAEKFLIDLEGIVRDMSEDFPEFNNLKREMLHSISEKLYDFYDNFLHNFDDDFTVENKSYLTKAVHSLKEIVNISSAKNMDYKKAEYIKKYFNLLKKDIGRWSQTGDVYLIRHPEKPQKNEKRWGWSSEAGKNDWIESKYTDEELKKREWSWEGAVETYKLFSRYFTPIILAAPKPVVLNIYVSDQKRTQMLGEALSKYQKKIAEQYGKYLKIDYTRDTDIKLVGPYTDKYVNLIRGARKLDKGQKDHEHEFEAQLYWMSHPDEFPGTEKPKDIAKRVRRFLVRRWDDVKRSGNVYNISVGFSHKESILPFLVESAGFKEFIEPLEIIKYHDSQVYFKKTKTWRTIKPL